MQTPTHASPSTLATTAAQACPCNGTGFVAGELALEMHVACVGKATTVAAKMTDAMRRLFECREDKYGLRRSFHTGRGGWPEGVAKALERRGWARLVKRHTWETDWLLTDAGVAAWEADKAARAEVPS